MYEQRWQGCILAASRIVYRWLFTVKSNAKKWTCIRFTVHTRPFWWVLGLLCAADSPDSLRWILPGWLKYSLNTSWLVEAFAEYFEAGWSIHLNVSYCFDDRHTRHSGIIMFFNQLFDIHSILFIMVSDWQFSNFLICMRTLNSFSVASADWHSAEDVLLLANLSFHWNSTT